MPQSGCARPAITEKRQTQACAMPHAPPTMRGMTKEWSIPLVFAVAFAGAIGTLARWGAATVVQRFVGGAFPWGVFVVNMLGCLLFGLVVSLAHEKQWLSPTTQFVLLAGFMGAFTTFSTFAFDTSLFVRDAQWGYAAANLIGQNILGVVCVFAGLKLGQAL